jgi:D-alanyl-D-alanine carboxypeptidase/D-alanyl-D-alanine-endopeptidase (penicillin-binding protein 4)
VAKKATRILLEDSAISQGHIGVSIYEPATGKYWYEHDADKYFIPASNTKLFSLYAGMKYLGDSLVSARVLPFQNDLVLFPAADPTFLNSEFNHQPLLAILKGQGRSIVVRYGSWRDRRWGNGWAWNDYQESYMVERSAMPVYGNLVKFFDIDDSTRAVFGSPKKPVYRSLPKMFSQEEYWQNKQFLVDRDISFDPKKDTPVSMIAARNIDDNKFHLTFRFDRSKTQELPFATSPATTNALLEDTLHKKVWNENQYFTGHESLDKRDVKIIYSQPTDSLFKPMMHRSDNFFAEQTLLMASNEKLGYMSDRDMIDSILKTDLKNIPQKPKWVDGSGLSRYNLFTPQSFVYILNKMKNEFGWNRMKNILPTGGEGTISSYYKKDAGFIFAKTGTLSNNCALSGYLITKKNKVLVFSVLANNYQTSATPVRRAVEKFLQYIRDKY